MKVSVGMITYNGENYIGQALESVLSQKSCIDELVICDDASTDKTVEIANTLIENTGGVYSRIIQNQSNIGNTLNAMKCYAELCSGDIVIVADQDDISLPGRFESLIKCFDDPDVCLVFSDAEAFFEDDMKLTVPLWKSLGFCYDDVKDQKSFQKSIMKRFTVSGCTMAFKKEFVGKCKNVGKNCANDMWIAWNAPIYGKVVAINDSLVLYRQHGNIIQKLFLIVLNMNDYRQVD